MKKRGMRNSQSGFSVVELMIALFIMTLVIGALFSQMIQGQQYSAAERTKLDLFQEAREFMDQMSRDMRAAGYPNTRNFASDTLHQANPNESVGLVKLDKGELWFESAINGDQTVYQIHYRLDPNCAPNPPCLVRSQAPKNSGNPDDTSLQAEHDQTEVQNVYLPNGVDADPIFSAYNAVDGSAVSLPITFSDANIANINTIMVRLTVQSPVPDKTGKNPTMTLISTIRLNNCTVAYPYNSASAFMGCE